MGMKGKRKWLDAPIVVLLALLLAAAAGEATGLLPQGVLRLVVGQLAAALAELPELGALFELSSNSPTLTPSPGLN